MTFPRYPEYKDSGVEWLGEVPGDWRVVPLKHIVRFVSGGTPSKENEEYWNGNIPWASAKDLKSDILWDTEDHLTEHAIERGAATLLEAPAVLIVVRGMILARTFPVSLTLTPMAINQDLKGILTDLEASPEFIAWYLRGTADESLRRLDEAGHGTKALRMDAWASLSVSLPSLPDQTTIVAFLDRETAKVDALVAEQERLIELLKEKRQAVISHAVTKGLNSQAPLKDSGIEWLGEVPEHWKVGSLKRFWSVIDCKHITAEFIDEGIPLASIREVQSRFVDLSAAKQTTNKYYDILIEEGRDPRAGDLIVSRNATVGEVAQVADWHPPFAMGQDVCLLRKQSPNYCSDFLQSVFRSKIASEQLALCMIGSTFKRVNVEEIRSLTIPMPPAAEQESIAAFLGVETVKIDTLITEAQHAIGLLKEHRSALISAAVTGKIDVRGLVVVETETEAA